MKGKFGFLLLAVVLICLFSVLWTENLSFQHVGENTEAKLAYEEHQSKMEESGIVEDEKVPTVDLAFPKGYFGKLSVQDGRLCGENGESVQLRGVSTHGIGWYPEYVNEEAVAYMHDQWGMDVLRLALFTTGTSGFCVREDSFQEQLMDTVERGVEYATANEMYVIIDWHILEDGNPGTYLGRAKTFFSEVSAKYADNPRVIYEICNEPNGGVTWGEIKAYAEVILPLIRANSKDAIVIVGTPNWSQDVDVAAEDPIADDHVLYALHFYAATHKGELRAKAEKAIQKKLPIFVTEFSTCDASGGGANNFEEADKWMELLDTNQISYVQWNLSNKGESSALIKSGCGKLSQWTEEDLTESGKWMLSH